MIKKRKTKPESLNPRMAFAAEGSEQLATASSWPFRRDPAEEPMKLEALTYPKALRTHNVTAFGRKDHNYYMAFGLF